MQPSQHFTLPQREAIAKATLLIRVLHSLSRSGAPPIVHAVAAHLIARSALRAYDTGPHWTVTDLPQGTLARRLAVTPNTIKKALRQLEAFNVVFRQPGRGALRSKYIINECYDVDFTVRHQPTGGIAHDPRVGSPTIPGGIAHDPTVGTLRAHQTDQVIPHPNHPSARTWKPITIEEAHEHRGHVISLYQQAMIEKRRRQEDRR